VGRPALRGVDLLIVRRLDSVVVFGTTMLASGCTAPSNEFLEPLGLLSARLCIIVLLSSRTALVLTNPPELDPEVADSSAVALALLTVGCSTLEVSIRKAGDRPLSGGPFLWPSSSTHPAGVGGTGPSAAMPFGGGRRVGGEAAGGWLALNSDG